MQKVKNLPGWIPQPGGVISPGDTFPTHADQVTIERVLQVFKDHVLFACKFVSTSSGEPKGRSVFYDFPMLDEKSGTKIAEILHNNLGRTLLSIGEIEIPSD
jgi:hypothetical protein